MRKPLFFLLLTYFVIVSQAHSKNHNWQADGGGLQIYFFYDLLNDYGIDVNDGLKNRSPNWVENELLFNVRNVSGLDLYVPDDGLKGVPSGQLMLEGSFSWHSNNVSINFKNLSIHPVSRKLRTGELTALEMTNEAGEVLFYFDHIHAGFNENKSLVEFNNMDVRISEWLAEKLAKPELSNLVIAHSHMKNHVSIPTNYEKDQQYILGGCTMGGWPTPENPADVQLIFLIISGNTDLVFHV